MKAIIAGTPIDTPTCRIMLCAWAGYTFIPPNECRTFGALNGVTPKKKASGLDIMVFREAIQIFSRPFRLTELRAASSTDAILLFARTLKFVTESKRVKAAECSLHNMNTHMPASRQLTASRGAVFCFFIRFSPKRKPHAAPKNNTHI